jgi:hypothetical protein
MHILGSFQDPVAAKASGSWFIRNQGIELVPPNQTLPVPENGMGRMAFVLCDGWHFFV